MKRHSARLTTLLSLSVMVGACGDAGPDLGELTEAEAGSLLAALSLVWFPSPSAPTPALSYAAAPGPSLVPETTLIQDTTEIAVSCGGGGIANVFSVDSLRVTVDVRLNPSPDTTYASNSDYGGRTTTTVGYESCASFGGQGQAWTFDASPGLTFTYDITGTIDSYGLSDQTSSISTTTNWSGLWSGAFNWSNGNRSGSCTISLTSTSSTSNIGGQISSTFSQQGQICGISVSAGT